MALDFAEPLNIIDKHQVKIHKIIVSTEPSSKPLTTYERYLIFVERIILNIENGKLLSKEHIYRILRDSLESGTGEIFERSLEEHSQLLQANFEAQTDEVKQAKATQKLRAMKILKDAWAQWQENYQLQDACTRGLQAILTADSEEKLSVLVQVLDPNQGNVFERPHIQQLAELLQKAAESEETEAFGLRQMAIGLLRGLASFDQLEGSLVSWLYESQRQVGFERSRVAGPWQTWSQQITSPLPKDLFSTQANNQSAAAIAQGVNNIDLSAWVELIVLLRYLQRNLVLWFDQQPYNANAGIHMAGTTYVAFAMIWSEISGGFQKAQQLKVSDRQSLAKLCFRISLQVLRTFAQRENFPLYGGVFASFSGESFRETINYLDQPLKESENTQEKARILTVLGHSQTWMGNHQQAIALHQEALTLAREVGDQRCEIANLNHISRISLIQKDFANSESQAQRAVILARQVGDRQGEANALANLGYSEVMLARQQEVVTPEELETPINHLERGQKLSEKLDDLPNQALCWVGLGTAYVAIAQPRQAQIALEKGLLMTQKIGDRDLQALCHSYLGESLYQLGQLEAATYHACLGMYLLEQRHSKTWQQAAALVAILQGKLGKEGFLQLLQQLRSQFIPLIGVDGFDYIPNLIERYRSGN